MRALTLALLLGGCGTSAAAPGAPTEGSAASSATSSPRAACTERYDITSTPGTTFEDVATDAVVPWPPPGVTFRASVERAGEGVRVVGVLHNASAQPARVDFLTGGVIGLSTNPFQVDIDTQPATATGPEVYPAPRRALLPAGGSVTYQVERCPPLPAHVRWTFTPWSGAALQGEALVR